MVAELTFEVFRPPFGVAELTFRVLHSIHSRLLSTSLDFSRFHFLVNDAEDGLLGSQFKAIPRTPKEEVLDF